MSQVCQPWIAIRLIRACLCRNPTRPFGTLALITVVIVSVSYSFDSLHAQVQEPSGYRMDNYDSPVPESLTGATRVSVFEAHRLQHEANAIIIDVIPEQRKPDVLPEGQIWLPNPHKGISGALWLPDVGFGALSDTTATYFKEHLQRATQGNPDHPIIFYCRAYCWMSWNAAKRAVSLGYAQVYWYAQGVFEWEFEGYDVDVLRPEQGQRH